MRILKAGLGLVIAAAMIFTPSLANAAPSGGQIRVWVTPGPNDSPTSDILVTGAIGDYGKATSHDKNGKIDASGNYVTIKLQKGTFEVNSVALDAKANNAQPTDNPTTCSAYLTVAAPVTLSQGTGAYKGISGTIIITETFAFLGPRVMTGARKGQCNNGNNVQPLSQYGQLTGVGAVSFSG
jgi:hypothetical protein